MFLIRKCCPRTVGRISLSSAPKNHYDSLNVKQNATQGEIKSAYYELSKLYHPDTNKGSEENMSKFRQVTDAYEVLGNVKSRKMYDRGLVVGSAGTVRHQDVDDDPTTKFYKQREKRSKVPTYSEGGPTVYDFDAWAKAHYDRSRELHLHKRNNYKLHMSRKFTRTNEREGDIVVFGLGAFLATFIALMLTSEDYDQVEVPKKEKR